MSSVHYIGTIASSRRNRQKPNSWRLLLLLCSVLSAVGCASTGDPVEPIRFSPEELLSGHSLGVSADSATLPDESDVLSPSAEMIEFLRLHVHQTAPPRVRLHQLLDALIDSGTFEVEYETVTRTASDTFSTRRGNCLSYALMFVALAREAGLPSGFQEVDVPPDWTLRDKAFVLNRHVNVFVDLGSNMRHVVDFNVSDFQTNLQMRRISDGEALAHYYSNIGVDSMHDGATATALAAFGKAIAHSREYAPAWIHTGLIYMRSGDLDRAKAAYLRALKTDSSDLVAMSNLADVYKKMGDDEQAARYRRKVALHRSRNPYYRFALAQQAYMAGRWDEAIRHLEYAVEQKPDDHRLHFHLALAHFGKGDLAAAKRSIEKARDNASEQSEKATYSTKMRALINLERDR